MNAFGLGEQDKILKNYKVRRYGKNNDKEQTRRWWIHLSLGPKFFKNYQVRREGNR